MRNYVTTYDPFFDFFFPVERKSQKSVMMDTDIKECKDHFEVKINLPEVKKEDIKVSLKNGYLTISAKTSEENDSEGEYIFKERRYGEYSRSYYVGDELTLKDVSGKLDSGVLKLEIKKPTEEERHEEYLQIN